MKQVSTASLETFLRQIMPELGNGVHLGWCTQSEAGRPAEYAGGRSAARQALRRGGYREEANLLAEAATGLPLWPEGWLGSISHSRGQCVAAVASSKRYLGIGLDLEHLGRMRAGTIRKVCSAEELAELPEGRESEGATRLFSLKEAFYKAQSPVYQLEPNYADLSLAVDWSADIWKPGIRRKSGVLEEFNASISMFSWAGQGLCLSLVLLHAPESGESASPSN